MISLKKWLTCTKCDLYTIRRNVVLGRGTFPADVLFIGEAPGKSEDLRGEAFVGPSGRLLNKMIKDAIHLNMNVKSPSIYITNTLGCRPCDIRFGANRQPKKEEILACMERVLLTYDLCDPSIVIFLGKVAEEYYKKIFHTKYSLPHPSYLLRTGADKSPFYLQSVRRLSDIFRIHL